MKPALQAFLPEFLATLNKLGEDHLENKSAGHPLSSLKDVVEKFDESLATEEDATKLLQEFEDFKAKFEKNDIISGSLRDSTQLAIREIEDEAIFMLKLLLAKEPDTHEIKMSSLINHFIPYLSCPFQIKLVDNRVQFTLFYEDFANASGPKQRADGQRFYNVLRNLGIVNPEDRSKEKNNRLVINIASNQVRNLLRLAQFDLVADDKAPKKEEDLRQQLKNILAELIETEVSFSEQAKNLGDLLEKKIEAFDNKENVLIKITPEDREFLIQAAQYYQEIGNHPYIWFGADVNRQSLESMPFEDMLELCNQLYENLQGNSSEAQLMGKRVACLRWITVNYSKLNNLINSKENPLNLTNEIVVSTGRIKQSQKDIASQNLITPVQRLPRIVLLTSELKKCIDGFSGTGAFTQLLQDASARLNALRNLWLGETKRANEVVRQSEEGSNAHPVQKLLGSLGQFIGNATVAASELSASSMAQSVLTSFKSLPSFSAIRSAANTLIGSVNNISATSSTTDMTGSLTASSTTPFDEGDFEIIKGSEEKFEQALATAVLFGGQETYESKEMESVDKALANPEQALQQQQSEITARNNSQNNNNNNSNADISTIDDKAMQEQQLQQIAEEALNEIQQLGEKEKLLLEESLKEQQHLQQLQQELEKTQLQQQEQGQVAQGRQPQIFEQFNSAHMNDDFNNNNNSREEQQEQEQFKQHLQQLQQELGKTQLQQQEQQQQQTVYYQQQQQQSGSHGELHSQLYDQSRHQQQQSLHQDLQQRRSPFFLSKLLGGGLVGTSVGMVIAGILTLALMPHVMLFVGIGIGILILGAILGGAGGIVLERVRRMQVSFDYWEKSPASTELKPLEKSQSLDSNPAPYQRVSGSGFGKGSSNQRVGSTPENNSASEATSSTSSSRGFGKGNGSGE